MSFQHFSHEHRLRKSSLIIEVFCSMCNRSIPALQDDCYYCDLCRCYLHQECAELPERIDHYSLHPLHPLFLTKRSFSDSRSCYYCEKPLGNDQYFYVSSQFCSNLYMHVVCALIPLPSITFNVDGGEDHDDVVRFVCRQQPMTLVELNERPAQCFACQSNWSGPAYSCTFEKCENFVHKSCTELPQKIQHPFHSPHSLILRVSKPPSCRSCHKKNCRLVFICLKDGCNFNLGIECAALETIVECQSHDHLLSLVEKSSCEIQCDACQKSYENGFKVVPIEVNHTRSILFRCMDCVFNFHFLCGPLPSTIKYAYHIHPLILSNSSVFQDDSDEYYCDVCEEERDAQSFRVYYCAECKYVAHIHCLIYEIMKVIKGETKDVKLMALGEDRWDHELDHQPKELTLRDVMNMLTEQEKKILMDPFTFFDPSRNFMRSQLYGYYSQRNSCFDYPRSVEDIDMIQKIFGFQYTDIVRFRVELSYFTPEEGLLKLDEKYLRQKVEDVDGYMVPKTLARILETLLRKYGDLGGKESLTPAMKSVTSTLLCIVIDRMCRTKVEDITKDDLRQCNFYLKGIKRVTDFQIDQYMDDFAMETFFGFEAIRYERDVRETLENKITTLKAELERCKENREKVKIYKSKMSDFMKKCLSKASEWKLKNWGDKWF